MQSVEKEKNEFEDLRIELALAEQEEKLREQEKVNQIRLKYSVAYSPKQTLANRIKRRLEMLDAYREQILSKKRKQAADEEEETNYRARVGITPTCCNADSHNVADAQICRGRQIRAACRSETTLEAARAQTRCGENDSGEATKSCNRKTRRSRTECKISRVRTIQNGGHRTRETKIVTRTCAWTFRTPTEGLLIVKALQSFY